MPKSTSILACIALLGIIGSAHAQANLCKNKVFITNIYPHQTGSGRYEYILQVQNATKKPSTYLISFRTMPTGVTVNTPTITSSSPLAPGAGASLRFATGSNANINVNSVSIGYDAPGSAITISNCK